MEKMPKTIMRALSKSLNKLSVYASKCRSLDEQPEMSRDISYKRLATMTRQIDAEIDSIIVLLDKAEQLLNEYINSKPDSWRTGAEGMMYRKWAFTWGNLNLKHLRSPLGMEAARELDVLVMFLSRLKENPCEVE